MKNEAREEVKLQLYIYHLLNYNNLDSAFICQETAETILSPQKCVWVREVGNYLSDVSLFKHSINDLSELCVSTRLNQIKAIMTMSACEDLQSEKRVTSLKKYFLRGNWAYSLIKFREGKLRTPREN